MLQHFTKKIMFFKQITDLSFLREKTFKYLPKNFILIIFASVETFWNSIVCILMLLNIFLLRLFNKVKKFLYFWCVWLSVCRLISLNIVYNSKFWIWFMLFKKLWKRSIYSRFNFAEIHKRSRIFWMYNWYDISINELQTVYKRYFHQLCL